jgi:hypothetical protein
MDTIKILPVSWYEPDSIINVSSAVSNDLTVHISKFKKALKHYGLTLQTKKTKPTHYIYSDSDLNGKVIPRIPETNKIHIKHIINKIDVNYDLKEVMDDEEEQIIQLLNADDDSRKLAVTLLEEIKLTDRMKWWLLINSNHYYSDVRDFLKKRRIKLPKGNLTYLTRMHLRGINNILDDINVPQNQRIKFIEDFYKYVKN